MPDEETKTKKPKLKDFWTKSRYIWMKGSLDSGGAKKVIERLLYYDSLNDKPIKLFINSTGGSANSSFAVMDTIETRKSPVYTICLGQASSGAAFVLSCGQKGKRYASKNSEIMIHQPSWNGGYLKATDWKISSDVMLKLYSRIARKLSETTGQSVETILKDLKDDKYLTTNEAIEYGLVDHVWEGE